MVRTVKKINAKFIYISGITLGVILGLFSAMHSALFNRSSPTDFNYSFNGNLIAYAHTDRGNEGGSGTQTGNGGDGGGTTPADRNDGGRYGNACINGDPVGNSSCSGRSNQGQGGGGGCSSCCILENSILETKDRGFVIAKDLKPGDMVRGANGIWNKISSIAVHDDINYVKSKTIKEYVKYNEYYLNNGGIVKITPIHAIAYSTDAINFKWGKTEDVLAIGNYLLTDKGYPAKITKIKEIKTKIGSKQEKLFYYPYLNNNENRLGTYFTDGVLSGDFWEDLELIDNNLIKPNSNTTKLIKEFKFNNFIAFNIMVGLTKQKIEKIFL